jgi:hypothetical protein
MWFYCIGGMLWYSLFYRSRYIPRVISLFGIVAAALAFVAVVFMYFGVDAPLWMSIPLLPFELTIGFWLLIKGIDTVTQGSHRMASPQMEKEG